MWILVHLAVTKLHLDQTHNSRAAWCFSGLWFFFFPLLTCWPLLTFRPQAVFSCCTELGVAFFDSLPPGLASDSDNTGSITHMRRLRDNRDRDRMERRVKCSLTDRPSFLGGEPWRKNIFYSFNCNDGSYSSFFLSLNQDRTSVFFPLKQVLNLAISECEQASGSVTGQTGVFVSSYVIYCDRTIEEC